MVLLLLMSTFMVLAAAIADLGVHKMAEDSIEDSELPDCDCDVSRQETDL